MLVHRFFRHSQNQFFNLLNFYIYAYIFISRFDRLALLAACGLSGCSDDGVENKDPQLPPTVDVSVDEVNRTTASFTINTNNASDYVYAFIAGCRNDRRWEALFERGPVRYFEGEKTVKVDLNDLAGLHGIQSLCCGTQHQSFSLQRSRFRGDRYACSYTEMITLESVGLLPLSYHIMKPEGDQVQARLSFEVRLRHRKFNRRKPAFVWCAGAEATEDQTYNFDTTFFDIVDFRQDIYSDMEFIIVPGEVDENGQVAESAVKSLLFKTKKAGVAPYDFEVSVGNGSMTADIAIEPEEGIERFHHLLASGRFRLYRLRREGAQKSHDHRPLGTTRTRK